MNKTILFLSILLLLNAYGLFAQNAPLCVVGNRITTGTTLTVPITVSNFSNIASCNLKLFFDPAIAIVTSVTTNPLISGANTGFNYNNTIPGAINFGWYASPGKTVPDNTPVFYIHFSMVASGYSAINFSTVNSECIFYDGSYNELNDSPFASYYTSGSLKFQGYAPHIVAPTVTASAGSNVSIPVKVSDFNTIGAVSLTIHYDPLVLTFLSGVNTSGYPGLTINKPSDGVIIVGGFSSSPVGETYADNTTFFTLNFLHISGSTALSFFDDGASCEYQGPLGYPTLNDSPQATYYTNGAVNQALEPIVNVKIFLEGPYSGSGLMTTTINTILPLSQPYNTAPWYYAGTETVTAIPADVTDWILIELRTTTASSSVIYTCAGFLRKDGFIADLNGNGLISLATVPAGNYFLVIKHRNHLAVMSANSVYLHNASSLYDFTTAQTQAFGTNPMKALNGGYFGMLAGDANSDGTLTIADRNSWRISSGSVGYLKTDFTMDGTVTLADFNKWRPNSGSATMVP